MDGMGWMGSISDHYYHQSTASGANNHFLIFSIFCLSSEKVGERFQRVVVHWAKKICLSQSAVKKNKLFSNISNIYNVWYKQYIGQGTFKIQHGRKSVTSQEDDIMNILKQTNNMGGRRTFEVQPGRLKMQNIHDLQFVCKT